MNRKSPKHRLPARRKLRCESLESRRVFSNLPIATPNDYSTDEDQVLTGNLISEDTGAGVDEPGDVGGNLVAVAINGEQLPIDGTVVLPSGVSVTLAADGTFTYAPSTSPANNALADGEAVQDTFEYTVADGFSSLHVFGDSLSDTGNLFTLTGGLFPPDPPYAGGRSSNGELWVEYLSPRLNLDSEDVNNFAVYGAQTGTGNFNEGLLGDLPGLADQIDGFTGSLTGPADPEALYVVWAGANDFLSPPEDPQAAITESISNLITAVGTLSYVGAEHIMVVNMPDLGVTPLAAELGLTTELTAFSGAFNGALSATLTSVGLDVIEFDAFSFFTNLVENGDEFGFTNVTEPCFDGATLCGTGEGYGFWDSVHPTTRVHELLADSMLTTLLASEPMSETDTALVTVDIDGVTTVPIAMVSGPAVAVPGHSSDFTFSASDASSVDEAAPFEYAIDWDGDGSVDEQLSGPASGITLSHVFGTVGVHSVTATVTDQDGDQSPPVVQDVGVVPAAVIDGDLVVGGTEARDSIWFRQRGTGYVYVFMNSRSLGRFQLDEEAKVVAYGLGGNDYIAAGNIMFPAHFTGGVGDDLLIGSKLGDRLNGGDGSDRIYGFDGDDVILGGGGRDWIFAGLGDDLVMGGAGNDFIFGQWGNDMLLGDAGNDRIFGGFGDDIIRGGAGNDQLFGESGDDMLDGGEGFDMLFGGLGDDSFEDGELVID